MLALELQLKVIVNCELSLSYPLVHLECAQSVSYSRGCGWSLNIALRNGNHIASPPWCFPAGKERVLWNIQEGGVTVKGEGAATGLVVQRDRCPLQLSSVPWKQCIDLG